MTHGLSLADNEFSSPGAEPTPKSALGTVSDAPRDPLAILKLQNERRIQELLPLRNERMSANPFSFYRGTAAIMAADQAQDPHSGILVGSCGDAHVSNFGFYASPQRTLQFDLNDFDESAWAPWEWDLKRLVTSVIIGGQATDRAESLIEQSALAAVGSYLDALKAATAHSPLERYYAHLDLNDAGENLDQDSLLALQKAVKSARKRTGARAAKRLTRTTPDGRLQFIDNPPVMTRVAVDTEAGLLSAFEQYRKSANVDVKVLLSQYNIVDIARRVVGVGSVGTRCYLALLSDKDGNHLILQIKEANQSVLETFGTIKQPTPIRERIDAAGDGGRVVGMQRILQAHSDPLLGHLRHSGRDYYVRQFHDMKGGIDIESLPDSAFGRYAAACARILARAHSQSPAAEEIPAYVGKGKKIAKNIVSWSEQYADRSLADYQAFLTEINSQQPQSK